MARPDSETQSFLLTGNNYAVAYSYSMGTGGWTQTTQYPGGREVTRAYDDRFRAESVNGGAANIGESWDYDLADRRISATLGNGIASLFQYDADGRLTQLRHALSDDPIHDVLMGYDEVGNRLYKKDLVNSDRSDLNSYDRRNRLRLFQRGTLGQNNASITELSDPILPGRHGWAPTQPWVDSRGNWLKHRTVLNGTNYREARTVNGVNEYTTIDPDDLNSPPDPMALSYDANGNLTSDPTAPNVAGYEPGQSYETDEENRLTRVTRTEGPQVLLDLRYDAIGRRVESVEYVDPTDGQEYAVPQVTRHIHAGLTVIEEYNVTADGVGGYLNERLREFLWGDRFPEPVAMIDRTSAGAVGAGTDEVFHYLRDDLGSVVGLTDAAGVLVERYVYDPYGQAYIGKLDEAGGMTFMDGQGVAFEASSLGNPWMWTGQRYDAGVKLYHFLFRGYSPHLGRWLQRDPIGYIDGPNLYQYVMSNPLVWTDPLGLSFWSLAPPPMLGVSADDPAAPGFSSSAYPLGFGFFSASGSTVLGATGSAGASPGETQWNWNDFAGSTGNWAGGGAVGGYLVGGGLVGAIGGAIGGAAAGAGAYFGQWLVGMGREIGGYVGQAIQAGMEDSEKRGKHPDIWPPPPGPTTIIPAPWLPGVILCTPGGVHVLGATPHDGP
jgi:RHS repeat-associated protein